MAQAGTKKKTVLYVVTKSNFGGAQRYVYDLALHAQTYGMRAEVALGGTGIRDAAPGLLHEKLTAVGVRTHYIRHFMRDMSFVSDIRAFFELYRIIRAVKPEIVHVTSSKAGGLGALAARLARVPRVVFTSHGLAYDESWRSWVARTAILVMTWATLLLADTTVMISSHTARRARNLPFVGGRVRLIHNGIEAPAYVPREEARSQLRTRGIPLSDRQLVIGTIAEYHPNKNLGVLISALRVLANSAPNAVLILIGDGECREELALRARTEGVAERVFLTGYIDSAASLLSAFDIFVLPSKKEGLPYVLLEAGLAALPTIVSDIEGTREIITHEKTGLVVPGTTEGFAEALQRYVTQPDMTAEYGQNLQQHIRTRFNKEQMLDRTYALYTPPPKPSNS